MATKSAQSEPEKGEVIEELLETLDSTLDRVKVLYEQYFLGIQKQAPTQLHTDVERKLRDLQQMQIRNTGLRYRYATLQQKFASYNNYWRRTLKQIENGTYTRALAKLGRQAVKSGQEIPEEILAAMPKRMRDQVKRDRDAAVAIAKRRQGTTTGDLGPDGDDGEAAFIQEPSAIRRNALTAHGAHLLSEDDGDLDMDAFFREIESEPEPEPAPPPPPRPAPVRAPSIGGVRTQIPITPLIPVATTTGAIPTIPIPRAAVPEAAVTQPMPGPAPGAAPRPTPPAHEATRQIAVPPMPARPPVPPRAGSVPAPAARPHPAMPAVPPPASPGAPSQGTRQVPLAAPSQVSRPNPVRPGASIDRPAVPVESMAGPFPRAPAPPAARPVTTPVARPAETPLRAPPGMSDADVNALYAKYVKAKEAVGDHAGPGAYGKLLKTINAQAPKIMEQYKAKGVEFSVVVKDNQVIIKAKPKT